MQLKCSIIPCIIPSQLHSKKRVLSGAIENFLNFLKHIFIKTILKLKIRNKISVPYKKYQTIAMQLKYNPNEQKRKQAIMYVAQIPKHQ
jgi:hypothetical protein